MTAWLLLNGGAVAVAIALARGATTQASSLGLAALSGYVALVHSLVLGAGLVGQLTVGGLALPLAVVLAGAAWVAWRVRPDGERQAPDVDAVTPAALFACLAAGAAAVGWAWPHLVGATRLWIWDDYTYHVVYPALWLRAHAIAATTPSHAFTMQAWYPLSASVVATWFMIPWPESRGDALAWVSLTGPLYAGLVATATATLLARLGCRPGAWALPLILLVTSARVGVMASSFSDADLALAATLLGGLAFAVPRAGPETARDVRTDAAYAAALTGLALGVKVSAAPLALIVLVMLLLRAGGVRGRRLAVATQVACIVAGGWIATAGYWYARNVVHTGNPVYPAAFLVWPGTTFPDTTLLEYGRRYGLARTLADALLVYANWPPSHALLAVLGLLGLGGWLVWRWRALPRGYRYFAGGALAMAATVLGLLPITPYSAGNAMTFRSGLVHWDSMRYVALVPMLGWLALSVVVEGLARRWAAALIAVVVAVVLSASSSSPFTSGPVLLALALAAGLLARRSWPLTRARPGPVACAVAVALLVAALVVGRHESKATATAASIVHEPLFGAVVAVLDRQPLGTRVAVFGDQWIYPTFGARDHLNPVRLDRDGRLAMSPVADAFEPGELTVEPARFRANLKRAGVDVVVIVRLPHPGRVEGWPTQDAALQGIGARLLHRDGATAVWRLTP